MPGAQVVVRRLNVMAIPIDREGALEQRSLAILGHQNTRPANLLPSVLLLVHALDKRLALEDLVLRAVHLLGMPYAAVGSQVGDHGALAEDIMVRFEAELDVQLIAEVESEIEVRKGVDAMVSGLDGGIVDLGDGGDGISYATAGVYYGCNESGGYREEGREAHGGAGVGGWCGPSQARGDRQWTQSGWW